MLGKLALLFLLGMVILAMISGRPKRGDLGWSRRRRLRLPESLRRLGIGRRDDD